MNERGDDVVVLDFDGTDPQSDKSVNFALSHEMLKMFVVYYLLTVFVSVSQWHVRISLLRFLLSGPGYDCE